MTAETFYLQLPVTANGLFTSSSRFLHRFGDIAGDILVKYARDNVIR
jgi:hypothetical protein